MSDQCDQPGGVFADAVDRGTEICVSVDDNIVQFISPNLLPFAQYEHIGVGAFSKG
jgi:hypothetical protein